MPLGYVLVGSVLLGCGRVAFSPLDGSEPDGDATGGIGDAGNLVTITFGESSTANKRNVTRDTSLSASAGPDNNYGSTDNLRIERDNGETALLAFDLAAMPDGATVVTAELTLWAEVAAADATIIVRVVAEPWIEGDLDGAVGVASYDDRLVGTAWTTPGALFPGSASSVIATFAPASIASYRVTVVPAVVQGWLADPATNHGLMFESSSDNTVRFVSSEGPEGQQPLLTLTYR